MIFLIGCDRFSDFICVCGVIMLFMVMVFRLNRLSRMLWCLCGMKLFDFSISVCSFLVDMCCLGVLCVLICINCSIFMVNVLIIVISGVEICISGLMMKLVGKVMCFG